MTLGDLGIPKNDHETTPAEMANIRKSEFAQATSSLNIKGINLGFPDMSLATTPLSELIEATLKVIRENKYRVIFTFHPYEITPEFDHPDHNATGNAARISSGAADIVYFYPEIKPLDERPSLYLFTTNDNLATHQIELDKDLRSRRNQYLINNYPSQFKEESKSDWEKIFDKITKDKEDEVHVERYTKVR